MVQHAIENGATFRTVNSSTTMISADALGKTSESLGNSHVVRLMSVAAPFPILALEATTLGHFSLMMGIIPAVAFIGLNVMAIKIGKSGKITQFFPDRPKLKNRTLKTLAGITEERTLVETYFIHHPRKFHGIVLKNSAVSEVLATHEVRTFTVRKGSSFTVEQEITELPGYYWDRTLSSIDELLTEPKTKTKELTR